MTPYMSVWLCVNGMALNPDRSEAIFRGTCRQRAVHSYSNLAAINITGCEIPLADHIKILGVDKILSVDNHVSSVSKCAQYHIRALRNIRSSISEDMAKMVACALVGCRLD